MLASMDSTSLSKVYTGFKNKVMKLIKIPKPFNTSNGINTFIKKLPPGSLSSNVIINHPYAPPKTAPTMIPTGRNTRLATKLKPLAVRLAVLKKERGMRKTKKIKPTTTPLIAPSLKELLDEEGKYWFTVSETCCTATPPCAHLAASSTS